MSLKDLLQLLPPQNGNGVNGTEVPDLDHPLWIGFLHNKAKDMKELAPKLHVKLMDINNFTDKEDMAEVYSALIDTYKHLEETRNCFLQFSQCLCDTDVKYGERFSSDKLGLPGQKPPEKKIKQEDARNKSNTPGTSFQGQAGVSSNTTREDVALILEQQLKELGAVDTKGAIDLGLVLQKAQAKHAGLDGWLVNSRYGKNKADLFRASPDKFSFIGSKVYCSAYSGDLTPSGEAPSDDLSPDCMAELCEKHLTEKYMDISSFAQQHQNVYGWMVRRGIKAKNFFELRPLQFCVKGDMVYSTRLRNVKDDAVAEVCYNKLSESFMHTSAFLNLLEREDSDAHAWLKYQYPKKLKNFFLKYDTKFEVLNCSMRRKP